VEAGKQGLEKLMTKAVEAMGYEYVGYESHPVPRGFLLRIYMDSPSGVTLSDCERASRQISALMDVEGIFHGKYFLEVSSPGLNRPLFTLDHFRRFIGHSVKIRLRTLQDGRRNFTGIIQEVEGEQIILSLENELITLKFIDIEKAHLIAVS
jgi:ribosome maturation factor RimP